MLRPQAALAAALLSVFTLADDSAGQSTYQQPPQAILDVLHAKLPPSVSINPSRDTLLLIETARYPSIAEMAEPILRLAGTRFNPKTSGPQRPPRVTSLTVVPIEGGPRLAIELPPGKVALPEWSPDGQRFAIKVVTDNSVDLYVGEKSKPKLTKIPGVVLNAAFGDPITWLGDSTTLIVEMVPANRGPMPAAPIAPAGPTVQQTAGKQGAVRTYQDLLLNSYDEQLYEYYATAQLAYINVETKAITPVGTPAIYGSMVPSPDGQQLLVSKIHRPFSYLYPSNAFPRTVEVWNRKGEVVKLIAEQPLQDKVPIEGVPTGRRQFSWRPTADATLHFVEALDGGDPKAKVPHRDQVFAWAAPFTAEPLPLFKTEHRYTGMSHFADGDRVLVTDYDRDRRWTRTTLRKLADTSAEGTVIFDRSSQDRYNDPGTPLTKRLANGRSAMWEVNGKLFLAAAGATPKGDRPTLNSFDLATKKIEPLFRCGESTYESASPLSDDGTKLLIRRESPSDPGNYFVRVNGVETPLTSFTDPAPILRKIQKQLVTTKRPDGVPVSFTLYLPPDYQEGEKRPTVFWAYPREFNTADTAGQVSGSTNRFTTIAGYSHLFFLLQGYVVMDEVSVPIVGPPDKANDTFVEQLVTSAKAAIDKAVEMGPVDRNRIGVGGHSYGAFMTANLLAHSDLFRAGIARSGAYNRTLTPFGFQNERRTYWEAPDVYATMSPFHNVLKINEPLLLIHGAADDNPGTFPIQSERLYQAIRGNAGTARLVLLPHESHGYASKETIEHVLAEQIAWFDQHVKGAKER